MAKFIGVLLVAVLLVGGWLYFDGQQKLQQSKLETAQLKQQVELLNNEVMRLNSKVDLLDQNSLDGMVREANSALLDGWESLVKTVDDELKKARKSLEQSGSVTPAPKPNDAPQLESPDGTERI